ncbi:MAG: lytic transglycosylase domain-containing protein [Desulfitobacteriaceae bacterium]|nr:lytic transglycosylase domain-containing protein [Desulfitobacteriaceae bacterium]MDD4345705.1 lytic transglycosylase domain-containing protein [Desulfitobacteriaceae bacterium]MDD4401355.1 lytic transglycosylase domain-containing protein [Desulfitobacteriaceae bacterium]
MLIGFVLFWVLGQTTVFQKLIYPYPYRIIIEKYAYSYGIDPLLVVSVIREESKFLPRSESHKGAMGLMQLIPNTAQAIAKELGDKDYNVQMLVNPEKNIQYGTWYLASLRKEFNDTILILAAYNGGRGHVKQWLDNNQINLAQVRQQDIPFKETREYVEKVLRSYQKYSELYPVKIYDK